MKKIVIAILIALAIGAGIWSARPLYREWKQKKFLTQAQIAWTKGDAKTATFNARKILEINPSNLEACLLMARITEKLKSPQAVAWRARVVELQPTATNRLELARTALLFGNTAEADHALKGVNEPDRNTTDFHTLAAMLSLARGDFPAAEEHCAQAAALDSNNTFAKFNLAVLHLQSTNTAIHDDAVRALESLTNAPNHRRDALRNLAGAALKEKDFPNARSYSQQLLAETNVPFSDRLLHLTILKQSGSFEMSGYLASLETLTATELQGMDALGEWLRVNGMSDEVLNWLLHSPEKARTNFISMQLIAECHSDRGEWAKVEDALKNQNWQELDFLRLAQLAHARRQLNQKLGAQADWRAAVSAASGKLKPLYALLDMTTAWHWNEEREEVAWRIVQEFPSERKVLKMLEQTYLESHNTPGLHKVYSAMMKYNSPDIAVKNNFAAVSLLLNRQVADACAVARENFEQHPDDPVLVSTYAYALHLTGRTAEGLKLFEKLSPDALRNPSLATYYGVLLTAAGQTNKATEYLQIAAQSPQLLPEEKALIANIRSATPQSR